MPKYLNVRVSFDIETTSYETPDGEKRAIVYAYAVCVDGVVSIFRTRVQFHQFLTRFARKVKASVDNRLVVYVHNLAFEYEFVRTYFDLIPAIHHESENSEWDTTECFFIGNIHRPARLLTSLGIEFRCSYLLTNAPLARVGAEVGVPKMLGDLDYELIRHHETPLTDEEIGYIENDVLILDALIAERLKVDTYATIPMTLTGYTRRKVRKVMKADEKHSLWLANTPISSDVYGIARQCFRGGYTHASAVTAGTVQRNVHGWDIASSYPASIAQFKFPMSDFAEVEVDQVDPSNRSLLLVEMVNVECKYDFAVVSESACEELSGAVVDNGRVWSADHLTIWMTDVDFEITQRNYAADYRIIRALTARSDYLPTSFVKTILDMYASKTTLKGVVGREEDYAAAKVDVNSVYGMTAEDPVHSEFTFDTDLHAAVEVEQSVHASLYDHNDSKSRFLFYPWSAFVTANSRYVLQMAIMDAQDRGLRVHYCDTDSIYLTGDEAEIAGLFDDVNADVAGRMIHAMKHHGLDDDYWMPKTITGEVKPLGFFEQDAEVVDEFKSLGAKRYCKVIGDKLSLTVSGLSKNAAKWLTENGGIEAFEDGMVVPEEHAGRLIHTYLDEPFTEELTDYLGNTATVDQHGGVHLAKSSYHLGMSSEYLQFLMR